MIKAATSSEASISPSVQPENIIIDFDGRSSNAKITLSKIKPSMNLIKLSKFVENVFKHYFM